jgi:hypothetical protein
VFPCCLPIKAMSLLKSPSMMMLLRGLLWIWLNIVVWIVGIRVVSFVIFIIWRYGEMFVVVGIFVIFPGNACCWWISISRPPLGFVYGWPWILLVWVVVVVLLNIILYCGNSLFRYLVDLDAEILVSWMAIMDGGVGLFVND